MSPHQEYSPLRSSTQLFNFLSQLSRGISKAFIALGSSASTLTGTSNSKGDQCLMGDIKCEEAAISFLTESRIPCKIASEEHGIIDLTSGRRSLCHIVMDGLDGSKYAQKDLQSHRYGTAIGILLGENPTLNDAVGTLFLKHGEGVSQILALDATSRAESGWNCSHQRRTALNIAIDDPMENMFPEYSLKLKQLYPNHMSAPSAQAFADIYQGQTDAFVRLVAHGNLEIAAFSAVFKHMGASIKTLSGVDFMSEPYLPTLDTKEIVVIGRSPEVTDEVLKNLLPI